MLAPSTIFRIQFAFLKSPVRIFDLSNVFLIVHGW